MKVALINRSDTAGGAAVVSLRLMQAFEEAGVEARMLVIDRQSSSPLVEAVGSKWRNKRNFLAERLGIFLRNGFSRESLFKIDTCACGLDLSQHPWVKDADVVMLAWVNQGMLSLKGIERLGSLNKPIVWVMHDMWNCTGVCHHAFECPKFKSTCESCHLLGKHGADLSTATQRRKRALYERVPITFVAVSHWLQGVCRESAIMRNANVRLIYNAFPIGDFQWQRLSDKTVPADKTVVIMGARRLDEPNKGFPEMIEAMQYVAKEKPALAERLHLLLYGDLKDTSLLHQIPVPHTYLGAVDVAELSALYRHSDIVLSTSLFENLPGTLIEGQASGCIPVTFGKGGQADIVDHLKSGYIAEYKSAESIAEGLQWAATQPISREFLHQEVARKFASSVIAHQFITLFQSLLHQ